MESGKFKSQQEPISHVDKKKHVKIYPKTISDWLEKDGSTVLSGPPGNPMRDRKDKIPDLDQLVYDYVVSNNSLGGTVTHASIANAVMDAFNAMHAAGRVDETIEFKATKGLGTWLQEEV